MRVYVVFLFPEFALMGDLVFSHFFNPVYAQIYFISLTTSKRVTSFAIYCFNCPSVRAKTNLGQKRLTVINKDTGGEHLKRKPIEEASHLDIRTLVPIILWVASLQFSQWPAAF